MTTMEYTRMWKVQRTQPEYCPVCKHHLKEDGKDYSWMMGWIDQGQKRHHADHFIQCHTCNNQTYQRVVDEWSVTKRSDAEALLKTGQYWNLTEVSATGNMACDHRTVSDRGPLYVEQTPNFCPVSGQLLPSESDTQEQETVRMMARISSSAHFVKAPTPEEIARADVLRLK